MSKVLNCSDYLRSKGHTLLKWSSGWKVRSPFSEDRNPSLMIWTHPDATHKVRSEHWYDFSNAVGGDVYTLVQMVEDCSFFEAVDIVGCPPPEVRERDKDGGIPLPDFKIPPEVEQWALVGEVRASLFGGRCSFTQADEAYELIQRGVTSWNLIFRKIGKFAD